MSGEASRKQLEVTVSRRAANRVVRHHAPIALGSVLTGGAVFFAARDARRAYQAWSAATAHVALLLLAGAAPTD